MSTLTTEDGWLIARSGDTEFRTPVGSDDESKVRAWYRLEIAGRAGVDDEQVASTVAAVVEGIQRGEAIDVGGEEVKPGTRPREVAEPKVIG